MATVVMGFNQFQKLWSCDLGIGLHTWDLGVRLYICDLGMLLLLLSRLSRVRLYATLV